MLALLDESSELAVEPSVAESAASAVAPSPAVAASLAAAAAVAVFQSFTSEVILLELSAPAGSSLPFSSAGNSSVLPSALAAAISLSGLTAKVSTFLIEEDVSPSSLSAFSSSSISIAL